MKKSHRLGGILICVWRFTFIEKDAVRGIRPWRRLTALPHLSKLPCGIRLNANPILLRRGALGTSRSYAKQKSHRYGWDFCLAQEEGFEPPCLLGKRFSRPPRYDRFDIPAYNSVIYYTIIRSLISIGSQIYLRIRFAYSTYSRQARL